MPRKILKISVTYSVIDVFFVFIHAKDLVALDFFLLGVLMYASAEKKIATWALSETFFAALKTIVLSLLFVRIGNRSEIAVFAVFFNARRTMVRQGGKNRAQKNQMGDIKLAIHLIIIFGVQILNISVRQRL